MTSLPYVEDFGISYGPIGITNMNSVGTVRDGISEWSFNHFTDGSEDDFSFGLPIAAETWDGMLNDINGFHVQKQHVCQALDSARGGPVQEGNVGGGTGMALYDFKGGSGTASRIFTIDSIKYTLGVFVQANFGNREELTISGVPVGKEIRDLKPLEHWPKRKDGSCITIVITDAPLFPNELKLLAKRVQHGLARTGTYSHNSSGEIFLALSTATPHNNQKGSLETWKVIPKHLLNPVFEATVQATEKAIINVLVAAKDMEGIYSNRWFAIPNDPLKAIMKKYNRSTTGFFINKKMQVYSS